MKLSSIGNNNGNNNRIYTANKTNSNKNSKNINFSAGEGIVGGMVKFWQVIEKGGRAAQFTCEDMFGTNLPRMYQGLMAGKKFTGEYNWKAFIQESIREILTGPTMPFFPMIALLFSKKIFGPSSNIKVENNNNLSDIMNIVGKNISENNGQFKDAKGVRADFFKEAIDDVLRCTLADDATDEIIKADSSKLCEAMTEYSDVFDKFQKAKMLSKEKKELEKAVEEKASEVSGVFEKILKKDKSCYDGLNFQTVKYTVTDALGNKKESSMAASSYFEHMASYIYDYTRKRYGNVIENTNLIDTSISAIKKFRGRCTTRRIYTLFNMIVLTGILMRQIPKLYTRGRVNPNAEEVYNEAKKREGAVK